MTVVLKMFCPVKHTSSVALHMYTCIRRHSKQIANFKELNCSKLDLNLQSLALRCTCTYM